MKPSITLGEVARRVFGITPDSFYRKREELEEKHGFPRPIPHSRPMMYDPDLVEAWRQGRYDARRAQLGGFLQPAPAPEPDDEAEIDRLLEARADELVAGMGAE